MSVPLDKNTCTVPIKAEVLTATQLFQLWGVQLNLLGVARVFHCALAGERDARLFRGAGKVD